MIGKRVSLKLGGKLGRKLAGKAAGKFAAVIAVTVGATLWIARRPAELPAVQAAPVAPPDPPRPVDAAQIATGRLVMERMPQEVGSALETFSDEIVRNAEATAGKQARITGTCAPGSAIRVIADDGTVRCQAFPKGVVSVSALVAIPRMSATATEVASVPGGTGRYQSAGNDDYLVAPIVLPDGALVTSFSFTFLDDSPEADTGAFLYRSDDQPLGSLVSTGAENRVRSGTTEAIQLRKIDATRYSYFVYFQVSARAGARVMPIAASVSYRLP